MPNPCLNGGQCMSTGGNGYYGGMSSYTCQCPPGFTGQKCESRGIHDFVILK